jgi:hypothetical protein
MIVHTSQGKLKNNKNTSLFYGWCLWLIHLVWYGMVWCSMVWYRTVPGHFAERHFAERHFAEWTFYRMDVLPNGRFAERTVSRKDNLPKAEMLFCQNVWDSDSFLNCVILNHCVK